MFGLARFDLARTYLALFGIVSEAVVSLVLQAIEPVFQGPLMLVDRLLNDSRSWFDCFSTCCIQYCIKLIIMLA